MNSGLLTRPSHKAGANLTKHKVELTLQLESGRSDIALRRLLTYVWIALTALSLVAVMTLIFLAGLQVVVLPPWVLPSLITHTVGNVAAMAYSMSRRFFHIRGG